MRKHCWTSKRSLAGWFLLILVMGCSPEPLVTGQVFDEFGKPVVGAIVQIQGTTFRDTTDSTGKYSVSYVPGNFAVDVQKQGFTSAHFALNIASPMQYPAAPVTLIPLPTTPGFYLFGRSDYQGVYYGAGIAGKVIDNVERIGVLNFAFKDQEFLLYTGGKAVPTSPLAISNSWTAWAWLSTSSSYESAKMAESCTESNSWMEQSRTPFPSFQSKLERWIRY
jgi:hypothetical protein